MTNEENITKSWRFQGKFLHNTYKTHVSIEAIKAMLSKKLKNRTYKIKVAHESGDENHPYLHTHVLIVINKRVDKRNQRCFDIGDIHPNIGFIKTPEHFQNLFKYLEKENCILDELDENDFTYNPKVILKNKIQEHNKWKDVINDEDICGQIHNCMKWARECFDCRPIENFTKDLELWDCQNEIIEILKNQNDRNILWICDKPGGGGKSVLSNFLIDNKDAFLCNNGALKDIAYAFDGQNTVLFDLPRTKENFTPYTAMECFKDGRLFSAKYTSCLKRFKPCKVAVFANFFPNLSAVSLDRWDIRFLENKKLRKYDIEESSNPQGHLNIIDDHS